jgi:hypothetical protein
MADAAAKIFGRENAPNLSQRQGPEMAAPFVCSCCYQVNVPKTHLRNDGAGYETSALGRRIRHDQKGNKQYLKCPFGTVAI